MPSPLAPPVILTDEQRDTLRSLERAHSTPQTLAFRIRLILRAAEPDQPTNWQISIEFRCSRHSVALWRGRYLAQGLAGLQDAPRPGRPRHFSPGRPHTGHLHRLESSRRGQPYNHTLEPG